VNRLIRTKELEATPIEHRIGANEVAARGGPPYNDVESIVATGRDGITVRGNLRAFWKA
jgi:hypothetical protein